MTPGSRVDALFGAERKERRSARPVIQQALALLFLGLPLSCAGFLLWTGVPGTLLVLAAWLRIDSLSGALAADELPPEEARPVRTLRAVVSVTLGLSALGLVVQSYLLALGQRPLWWPAGP